MTGMRPDQAIAKTRFVRGAQAFSLFALVAVVALRPLVSESYDSAGNSITRAVESLSDPSPARTLGFDLIILAATCLWLLSFALDRAAKYRWTGMEVGLVLLAIAGGVSCHFAGNKRLAINGTVDWLCLPILSITLVQLLRTRRQRRLMLAAILATASVNAVQCYEQYFLGFAETIEQYEAGKEEFWAKQGVDLDSTTVDAFERRLRAREASGFFAHSNVAGAYLMLCAFVAIGVISRPLAQAGLRNVTTGGVRGGGRNPWKAVPLKESTPEAAEGTQNEGGLRISFSEIARFASLIFTLAIAGAVFLTGSLGALVAGVVGVVVLLLAWRERNWIANHRRRVFWISWLVIMVAVAAVIGHGLYQDSLPGWSLTFRWQYWKASVAMIADHYWTGVGSENFGRHYTLYKEIASPEEVSNPHNIFVQTAAEWGVLGVVGVVTMLFGVSYFTVRRGPRGLLKNERALDDERSLTGELRPTLKFIWWAFSVGLIVVLGRALLLGSSDPNYVYYATATTGIIWLPVFAVFYWLALPSRTRSSQFSVNAVLAAGLFAFLLQEMISFAIFIPASATTFFALLAVWLSYGDAQKGGAANPQTRLRWIASVSACSLTLATLIFVLLPVYRCAGWLEVARASFMYDYAGGNDPKLGAYRAASAADHFDPTPWVEQTRLLTVGHEPALRLALASLSQANLRDPNNIAIHRRKSQLYLFATAYSHQSEDYLNAVEFAKSALALYPQDPAGLVSLADTELAAGKDLQSRELLLAAIGHYQEALSLDEKRLEWETIQRFRPRVTDEINAKILGIQVLLLEGQ